MEKQGKYIGIDLGGSKIRINDFDLSGKAGKERQVIIDSSINNEKLAEIVVRNVEKIIDRIYKESQRVAGIGFGSPGPLDYRRGIIETPPNLPKAINLPIVKILGESFPEYPAFLVHDADAALIGEQWFGAAADCKNVAMVTLGTGVGFAVMDNGRLIRGKGRASEAGHTDIAFGGFRVCSCNRMNHWEAFVSTDGLARTYCEVFDCKFSAMSPEERYNISFEMRAGLSKRNNSKWIMVLSLYCDHVTAGLRNILCNFDPACIILGGGIMNGNQPLFDAVQKNWNEYMFVKIRDSMLPMAMGMELRLAKLPNAGVIGAAKYAMDEVCEEHERYAAEHGIIT